MVIRTPLVATGGSWLEKPNGALLFASTPLDFPACRDPGLAYHAGPEGATGRAGKESDRRHAEFGRCPVQRHHVADFYHSRILEAQVRPSVLPKGIDVPAIRPGLAIGGAAAGHRTTRPRRVVGVLGIRAAARLPA